MKKILLALALLLPFSSQAAEQFVGVGIVLQQTEGKVMVMDLVPGGPAERSGLIAAGDEIIAVRPTNSAGLVPVERMDLEQVVNMIRGEEGTAVGFHMGRGSRGQYEVTLVRALITVP